MKLEKSLNKKVIALLIQCKDFTYSTGQEFTEYT